MVIKGASLARTYFLLIGAYLLNILKTATVTFSNILEKMSKALNKHIDYTDKNLLLLGAQAVMFLLFTTVIGTPIWIAGASISLVFLISNGIVKKVSDDLLTFTEEILRIFFVQLKEKNKH